MDMNLELIDELYNLVQTNDNDLMEKYKDKFQEFYDDRFRFIKYLDYEPKIYYILDTLYNISDMISNFLIN